VVRRDAEFEQFVMSRSVMLLHMAHLLTSNAHDAEDVLQVSLLRVARRWGSAREAPDAYARKVVMNVARDRRRRLLGRVRERPLEDEGSFPYVGNHPEAVISRDEVIVALRGLPARQREVVVLRSSPISRSLTRLPRWGLRGSGEVLHQSRAGQLARRPGRRPQPPNRTDSRGAWC
jgi:RNA polymerase sigma factor (sigma-70 family)